MTATLTSAQYLDSAHVLVSPGSLHPGRALSAFGEYLYAAWKGAGGDQRMWYSRFDGQQWSDQEQIPNAATGPRPALVVYARGIGFNWAAIHPSKEAPR
jgi:hypothetical protein